MSIASTSHQTVGPVTLAFPHLFQKQAPVGSTAEPKYNATLILTQDMSLNQISFEVGFNDYKYFTVSFKKQFNCLPSKYREKTGNK